LEKEVLECGAGVWRTLEPLLVRFHKRGYVTHGIEISEQRLVAAKEYCVEHHLDVDLRQGDMRQIPFEDASMSFVFSYNTIFHMTKADIAIAMKDIERVLKPGGLCFVNFLSVDDERFQEGEEVGEGEFLQRELDDDVLHSYYTYDEPDGYFSSFELLYKERRVLERLFNGERHTQGYIDYIARKSG
jgi:ubiquinone/menaquinone biosynthesis C-methylase UbiE